MAREAICTRDKDGLNSENVGVKDVTDSTRDLSSHVYVESWRDRVRVPQAVPSRRVLFSRPGASVGVTMRGALK